MALEMDMGLSEHGDFDHSVIYEHDYVSPLLARTLALQLELSCRLESHDAWAASLWHDVRSEGDNRIDHGTCHPFTEFSTRPLVLGTGATRHMDSSPDVEPCLDPGPPEIEFSTGVPCAFDHEHNVVQSRESDSVHTTGLCTDLSASGLVPSSVLLPASHRASRPSNYLVKGGSCRSFPDVAPAQHVSAVLPAGILRCRSHHRATSGHRVRFDFSVQFWFPAPSQMTLPRDTSYHSAAWAPPSQAEHVGFRSPAICSQAPSSTSKAEHVGFRSPPAPPVCAAMPKDFVVFEDGEDVDLSIRPTPTLPKQVAGRAPCSDVTNHLLSMPGAEHVGFRSPLHPCHSPSSHDENESCRDFVPFRSATRKKPSPKPALALRSPAPSHEDMPHGTLGYRVGGTSVAPSQMASVGTLLPVEAPSSKVPYSAFDSVIEHRILQAEPDWAERRFVIEAIKTSVFPGNPLGRFMRHDVAGYPSPQVMITPAKRFETRGSVVFDLRRLDLGIEVTDISPGASIAATLPQLRKLTSFPVVLNALRSRTLLCTVNGAAATAETVLHAEAEVIVFSGSLGTLTSREFRQPLIASEAASSSSGPFRPPTPPIPSPVIPAARRWGRARQVTQAQDAALQRLAIADDTAPICTIFDPHRQFHLCQSPSCANPSSFLAFAMAKVTYLGECVDGRILSFPLPGLPSPQACVHGIVSNAYVVVPVALGAGSFCTISVHRSATVLDLFEQLEQRCGIPRSYRHLLRTGWIACYINDRLATDVDAAHAFRFADSARIERTPALERRESPQRLEDVVMPQPAESRSVVIHRPGSSPLCLPPGTPTEDALADLLVDLGLLQPEGSLRPTNPTPAQVGQETHYLLLTPEEALDAHEWMIVDLQQVAHPPLAQFWTTSLRLPFLVPDFAEMLAAAFPSLPVVVGAFFADSDLELPQAIQQAPVVTAIGLPDANAASSSTTTVTATLAPTTSTTTVPSSPPIGDDGLSTVPVTPRPGMSSGSAEHPNDLPAPAARALQTASEVQSGDTQLVAVFDTILHVSLHCVPDSLSLAEVVAVVLQASNHLTPPLSFRVLRGTFAWLPAIQIVVWTEPLPGMRVLPVHMGDGELDFCTVSIPIEASAYETAIHIALIRPDHERLRYRIARGSRVLFADGQRTEPFLAWQLASADGGIIADYLAAPSRHFRPPVPVPTVVLLYTLLKNVLQYAVTRWLFIVLIVPRPLLRSILPLDHSSFLPALFLPSMHPARHDSAFRLSCRLRILAGST